MLKSSDIKIKNAVEILKRNAIRTSICIKCSEEFYIIYENGFKEQRDYCECDCGGELIKKKSDEQ